MQTFTIGLGRDWWVRLGRNPLVRSSDRIEVMVLSLAVLLTVVAVPIGGDRHLVYDAHTRVYAEEARTRHQVTATAIEDGTVVMQPKSLSFTARATWSAAGRDHSDIVTWSDQVKAGDQQSIWVNADGAKVGPPSLSGDAAADAVRLAIYVWLGVAAASAGLVYVVRRGLDRRRYSNGTARSRHPAPTMVEGITNDVTERSHDIRSQLKRSAGVHPHNAGRHRCRRRRFASLQGCRRLGSQRSSDAQSSAHPCARGPRGGVTDSVRDPNACGVRSGIEKMGPRGAARCAKDRGGSDEGSHLVVDTELVTDGVVPALVDLSKDAEMIVVGCRGLGAIRRRLLGSVSWGLVLHARCPVAVIHDEDPLMPTLAVAPVVVGIDGSPASEAATAIAFDEASRRGVDLVAVHAWSDRAVDELPGVEWPDVQKQAEEALAERLAGWQERYPDVTVRRVVALDRPAHQLLEQSESAQLTVLGSHGRGGFTGMLLGSVSSAVSQSARMPVIVARPS